MSAKATSTAAQRSKYSILIVDDHPVVRQGLAQLVNQEKDLEVQGYAEDAYQAMQAVKEVRPDMVIVDISLKDTSGMDLIKDMKVQYPNLPILILSMHDESLYAERALRAGAKGYIMKHEATERVITAIRRVLAGEIYVSDSMAATMVSKLATGVAPRSTSPVESLSDRELEVFRLIGEGHKTRDVADKLHLSVKTIETYRAHIKEKLGFKDGNELFRFAVEWVNSEMKR
ncbi:MAG: response regulator transcription factor [Sedimentisphaerales bacterium]|nr:response regulator transcription factor [Sedimentisphaerales bacterium]